MSRAHSARAALWPLVLLALSSCGPSFDEAKSAWDRQHPDSYVFDYQRNCSCPGSGLWWRVSVRHDVVVAATLLDSTDVATRNLNVTIGMHPTLSQMFDGIADFARRPHSWTRIRYDTQWHFPVEGRGDKTDRLGYAFHFYVRNFHPAP